jgi:hypothetical protein
MPRESRKESYESTGLTSAGEAGQTKVWAAPPLV